jgi:hypothetical protein
MKEEKQGRDAIWETLRMAESAGCVMVAESWEHGVSCSWGKECPLVGRG